MAPMTVFWAWRLNCCISSARTVRATQASVAHGSKVLNPPRTTNITRLLAVAAHSATHRSIQTLSDLSQDLVAQIEHFFVSYNEMKGKRFEVKGCARKKRALTLVTIALKKGIRR